MTVAWVLPTVTYYLAALAFYVLYGLFKLLSFGGGSGGDRDGRALAVGIVVITVSALVTLTVSAMFWCGSVLIHRVLSRYREYAADRAAAEITGSPAALASALDALDESMPEVPDRDLREFDGGAEALYVAPLESRAFGDKELVSTDDVPRRRTRRRASGSSGSASWRVRPRDRAESGDPHPPTVTRGGGDRGRGRARRLRLPSRRRRPRVGVVDSDQRAPRTRNDAVRGHSGPPVRRPNQSGRTYDFETETWRNVENATVSAVDGTGRPDSPRRRSGRRSLRRPLPSVRCSSLWKGTSHRDRPRRGGDRPRRAGDDRRDRRRRDRVGRRDPLAGQCRRNGRIERVRRVKQIGRVERVGRDGSAASGRRIRAGDRLVAAVAGSELVALDAETGERAFSVTEAWPDGGDGRRPRRGRRRRRVGRGRKRR